MMDDIRSFRGKMEGKVFQAMGETRVQQRKKGLMGWGSGIWYRNDECGAQWWTQTCSIVTQRQGL